MSLLFKLNLHAVFSVSWDSALAATSTDLGTGGGSSTPARLKQGNKGIKLTSSKHLGQLSMGLDLPGSSLIEGPEDGSGGGGVLEALLGTGPGTPGAGETGSTLNSNMSGTGSGSPGLNLSTGQGGGSDQEWNYDPNEPRYCICNQVPMLVDSCISKKVEARCPKNKP